MTSSLIYLVSILDDVKDAAHTGMILCLPVFLLSMFVCSMLCCEITYRRIMPYAIKIAQWIGAVFVICMALHYLLPSSNTAAAMYILPKVVNRERVETTDKTALKQFHLQVNKWFWGMEEKK